MNNKINRYILLKYKFLIVDLSSVWRVVCIITDFYLNYDNITFDVISYDDK